MVARAFRSASAVAPAGTRNKKPAAMRAFSLLRKKNAAGVASGRKNHRPWQSYRRKRSTGSSPRGSLVLGIQLATSWRGRIGRSFILHGVSHSRRPRTHIVTGHTHGTGDHAPPRGRRSAASRSQYTLRAAGTFSLFEMLGDRVYGEEIKKERNPSPDLGLGMTVLREWVEPFY